jgi:hypothetical protein
MVKTVNRPLATSLIVVGRKRFKKTQLDILMDGVGAIWVPFFAAIAGLLWLPRIEEFHRYQSLGIMNTINRLTPPLTAEVAAIGIEIDDDEKKGRVRECASAVKIEQKRLPRR